MPDEQLYIEVVGSSTKAVTSLTDTEQALLKIQSAFRGAAEGAGLLSNSLKGGTAAGATKMSTSIRQIASAITKLTTAAPSLSGALDKMVQGLNDMPEVSANAVKSLTDISGAFKGLGVSLKNTVTYAGQTGEALTALVNSANGLPELNANAKKTLSLLSNLAPTATRASKGMTNLGASMDRMTRSASKGSSGLFYMLRMAKRYITTGIFIHMFSKITSMFGESIKKTMEWTETVNFFNVAYGSLAETAGKFYETLADTLGLDVSSLANDAAIFTQMSKSLGFTNDEAYKLSRNLIMIGLDLASLSDSSFEETFSALRSGVLGGQYKPLATRYGINVQAAVLQETAEREGITEKVKNMTALEKAYLRYKTVLWGARIAQGDFTKTLESPINQLRVFKSATESLSRAFGSIFIPVIGRILPYVIAFTKCMQQAISAMGIFMGYLGEDWKNTADIDMTGIEDDLTGIGDAAGGSSAAVADLKKNIMGFDQFNILKDSSKDSGGGGGVGAVGGASFDMNWGDDWDLMLEQLQGNKISEIMDDITVAMQPLSDAFGKLFSAVKDVLPSFKALWDDVLAPLGLWAIGTGLPAVVNWLGDVAKWFADHPKTAENLLKILLAIKAASVVSAIALKINATWTGLGMLAPALLGSGATGLIPISFAGVMGALTVAAITFVGARFVGKIIVDAISEEVFPNKPIKTDDGLPATQDMYRMDRAARNEGSIAYNWHKLWGIEPLRMTTILEAMEEQMMEGFGTAQFGMPRDARELAARRLYGQRGKLAIQHSESMYGTGDGLTSSYAGQIGGARTRPQLQLPTMSAANTQGSTSNRGGGGTAIATATEFSSLQASYSDITAKLQTIFNTLQSGLAMSVTRGCDEALNAYRAFSNRATEVFGRLDGNIRQTMLHVAQMMSLLPKTLSSSAIQTSKNQLATSKMSGIKMYASGGFPEDGLFAANHGELVGKFSNGKTAVANNVQIVEGIKYGVMEGMSLAVNANGGSGGGSDYETVYKAIRDVFKDMKVEATPMIMDGNTVGEVVVKFINKKTSSTGVSPLKA